jgi:uncharacterized protein YerC
MRRKLQDVHKDVQKQTLDVLFETAELAAKKGTTHDFIKELLTESEQLMLGRRLLVARMLLSGVSQAEIRHTLRLSPNTVWKVNKWLIEQLPEYGEALKKTEKEREEKSVRRKQTQSPHKKFDPFTFAGLKKKYPMHFLLFNIADQVLKSKKS